MSNGSGDYVIAFSTTTIGRQARRVPNDAMSPLFQATIESTEEAIYNSLFTATTVRGHRGTVTAIPVESVLEILDRYGARRPPS